MVYILRWQQEALNVRLNKAKLARELKVTPTRIGQYAKLGMPFGADGRIELAAACAWVDDNIDVGRRRAEAPPTAAGVADESGVGAIPHARMLDLLSGCVVDGVRATLVALPRLAVIAAADAGVPRPQAERLADLILAMAWHDLAEQLVEGEHIADVDALELPGEVRDWRASVDWGRLYGPG